MVSLIGNSLLSLARPLAQELGSFTLATTTSTSSAATNLNLGGNAMVDSEAPIERYGGRYAYLASGTYQGQQARITRGGFVGATGVTTLANPINISGGVQVASGVTVELHGTIPRIDQDELVGIRTCINRAIRKMWTIYRMPITSTGADVVTYDLGALFWSSKQRFRRLLDPDPGGTGHLVPSSIGWNVIANADVWTLELGSGFPTGDVFYLECEIPLNYRLYLTGAWANQSSPIAGLVLDADACLGQFDDILQVSLYECMKALALQAGGNRKAYWADRVNEQRRVISTIKLFEVDSIVESLGEGQTVSPGAWRQDESKGLFGPW